MKIFRLSLWGVVCFCLPLFAEYLVSLEDVVHTSKCTWERLHLAEDETAQDMYWYQIEEMSYSISSDGVLLDARGEAVQLRPAFSGMFRLMTYNVAGLPYIINGYHKERFRTISQKLNAYDLIVVQEDFFYHNLLVSDLRHAYISSPKKLRWWEDRIKRGKFVASGLSRFTDYKPLTPVYQEEWSVCSGYFLKGRDCLATKGFSVATHNLAKGVDVVVYNLHMDTGGAEYWKVQMRQLLQHIQSRTDGLPVIAGGDWNTPSLSTFANPTPLAPGMKDIAMVLEKWDSIDHVLYRSSQSMALMPLSFDVLHDEFTDKEGIQLSDHYPVLVKFLWVQPSPSQIIYEPRIKNIKPIAPSVLLVLDVDDRQWIVVRHTEF